MTSHGPIGGDPAKTTVSYENMACRNCDALFPVVDDPTEVNTCPTCGSFEIHVVDGPF